MHRPTADQVRRALDSEDPAFARRLVLAARDVIADHCSDAWGYRFDNSSRVVGFRGVCGCRECQWLTPISRILLPEEMPAPTVTPMAATRTRRTGWRALLDLVGVGQAASRIQWSGRRDSNPRP